MTQPAQRSKRKPKFRVGQVVFIDEVGFYGRIVRGEFEDDEWGYWVRMSPSPQDAPAFLERDLRNLSKTERGQ